MAGTAAGGMYGVAKDAKLFAVKVFDSSGRTSSSTILAGLDYIIAKKEAQPETKMVVNMSFGKLWSCVKSGIMMEDRSMKP